MTRHGWFATLKLKISYCNEKEEYISQSAREETVGASLSQRVMESSLGASARTGNQVEAGGIFLRYRETECKGIPLKSGGTTDRIFALDSESCLGRFCLFL